MKIVDLIGNELLLGDLVAIKQDHVVGQVVKVESGEIARGLVLDGQPKGEVQPPHVVVQIQLTSVAGVAPTGQCPTLLKVQKPASPETV
jgi:hypothetical protein